MAARFRWATSQGHPSYLWPDIPPDAWRTCVREIGRVTAAVLASVPPPVRLETPEPAGARALGVAAYTSGMGPLLGRWLETGRVAADADVAALLALHLDHGRRRAERLGRELERALDVLAGAGIEATVIKGAHTARAYFPEPGTRPTADIDLVIDPAAVSAAERALARAGYVRGAGQTRPYKWDWHPADGPTLPRSLELSHAEDPFTVELHESLARNFFGVRTIDFGSAGAGGPIHWPELHDSARVLVQPVLAAYLAAHASEELHQIQLVKLVELVLVFRCDSVAGRLDRAALAELLDRTRAARFVYPALELADRLAPGTVGDALRARLTAAAPRRMRRVVERLEPATAQRLDRLTLEERFVWARGPVETVRRAAYLLLPTRAARSRRPFGRLYRERLFRILRGRFTLR